MTCHHFILLENNVIFRSFTTAFDAFLHLPDLNVRPTQIHNICLKIKKKEKYVCNEIRFPLHLWNREREWIRVCYRIFVYFSRLLYWKDNKQNTFSFKTNAIYILVRKWSFKVPDIPHTEYYSLRLFYWIFYLNDGILVTISIYQLNIEY